ncbi:MAG: DUF2391 family protein [Candidatus Promineifilaceae bacterium]|nr:DUF2391 family protein [Candidatus Promineifilaceae bacterium]
MAQSALQSRQQESEWVKELQSFIKSLARALIFGVGFLYTMETWWIGEYLSIARLLVFFFLAFLVNLYLLPIVAHGRSKVGLGRTIRQATRNKGMAIVVAALLLWLLGQVTLTEAPFEHDVTTIILLSIPIAIGANIAQILEAYTSPGPQESSGGGQRPGQDEQGQRSQEKKVLQEGEQNSEEDVQQDKQADTAPSDGPWSALLKTAAAVSGGALFVSFPLAPTGEIPMLAASLDFWRELGVIATSLIISYIMIYATGAPKAPPSGDNSKGAAIWPYADTLFSYALALVISLVVLFLVGRIDLSMPLGAALSLVLVLGLPATIGGAAGKLVL